MVRVFPAPRRVLVIDDDAAAARLLALALAEHISADIEEETDARVALARILRGERFDAILCDIAMPVMSGVELHAELVRAAPEQAARMLFVSGGLSVASAQYLRGLPNRLFAKPVELRPLLDALRPVVTPATRA
jgi:CheY-like chemotaxis protein